MHYSQKRRGEGRRFPVIARRRGRDLLTPRWRKEEDKEELEKKPAISSAEGKKSSPA